LKHLWIERPERSVRTGFAVNRLDRLSERRDDGAFIDELRCSEGARSLVFAGEVPVLKRRGDAFEPLFTFAEVDGLGIAAEQVFLGHDSTRPFFATLLETQTPEPAQGHRDIVMIDLRSVAMQGLVTPDVLGAFGQAKSLLYWHSRHRFCSNCGAPNRMVAAGWRRVCDVCEAQHFPRTDPVVIMLVVSGNDCLLGRQPGFPAGMYSCLAGFVEAGETCEDAVRREVFEEAGIATGRIAYVASQPWPFPASLMIGCFAEALARELSIDTRELDDARWFSQDEVRLMLARAHPAGVVTPPKLAIAHLLLQEWIAGEIGLNPPR
jgi:NAD+ diphosphatase